MQERSLPAKKPTAHSGTFGFANTQSQREKPKEPEFCQRTEEVKNDYY